MLALKLMLMIAGALMLLGGAAKNLPVKKEMDNEQEQEPAQKNGQ